MTDFTTQKEFNKDSASEIAAELYRVCDEELGSGFEVIDDFIAEIDMDELQVSEMLEVYEILGQLHKNFIIDEQETTPATFVVFYADTVFRSNDLDEFHKAGINVLDITAVIVLETAPDLIRNYFTSFAMSLPAVYVFIKAKEDDGE